MITLRDGASSPTFDRPEDGGAVPGHDPGGGTGKDAVVIYIDTLRMAFSEFASNKLRTVLTMLGIVIGVGAVIALMAAGQGAQKGVTDQVRGLGSNLIFIQPATTGSSGGGVQNLRSLTLTTDDAAALTDSARYPEIRPSSRSSADRARPPTRRRRRSRRSSSATGAIRARS
jgi:hypothetical protein